MSVGRAKRSLVLGRALAVLPVSILAVMGCGTLIGLDSYTVAQGGSGGGLSGAGGGNGGRNGANGGTGGSAGTGGNAGSSAGSGRDSGGRSGAGGSGGGSGGTAVAGTTSQGGGGQAGAPPGPQNVGCDGHTTFVPNDNVIRSCLLRAGCNPNFIPVRTVSECVSKNTQAALPGESCNGSSKTCADYEACEHIGIAHDDLCGGTQTTRCDANGRAINCGNYNVDEFLDCPRLGGTSCGTYTFAGNGLLYADCKVTVTANVCAGLSDDQAYYCQTGSSGVPDSLYFCYGGQAYGSSCTQFATCFDTTPPPTADAGPPKPDASCFFNFLAHCSGLPDSASCSNGVAKVCSAEDIISYDCSSVGLSCAMKPGSTDGYCVAPGCTPLKVDQCVESCGADGTTLTFCYGGVPYSVDCTAYGFTQCMTGTYKNASEVDAPFAACR